MNTRLYNARICTMQHGTDVIEGEIWVAGKRIAYVGAPCPATMKFDREINAGGNLIIPGFKNAHTHSPMTFLRSFADDLPLLDWLEKQVFPMEEKLLPEHIGWLTKLAIMEYLSSGITAIFDMYSFTDEIVAASIETGFRTVLCGSVNNFKSSVEELEIMHKKYNQHHELISHQLGFHAEYTCSAQLLQNIAALAHKLRKPVYTHNSESLREVQECIQRNGATPTEFLDSLGMFEYGGGGFHCVHVSENDLEIFKKRNMHVISNPGSNCKLASGTAPVLKMLDMGIPVALGTDGPASNNCLDMFREMFLMTATQKLAANDASALDGNTVLQMACVQGAKAMRLDDCDRLTKGKLADLVMIDLQTPNMQPINNLTRNLVYSGSKQNVKLTMINGKVLYENGKYNIGVHPNEVYTQVNKIVNSLR